MGFCFFGNVAVAARRATSAHGLSRVMIVDWDVHHGNGTNDIFHRDADVLFLSIHESPLYPGTGPETDVGSGPGTGFTVNLPVPGGSGDAVVPVADRTRGVRADPDVGARAGAGQRRVRRAPRRPAGDLPRDRGRVRGDDGVAAAGRDAVGAPLGLVLEGGYDLGALSRSMAALMPVLVVRLDAGCGVGRGPPAGAARR